MWIISGQGSFSTFLHRDAGTLLLLWAVGLYLRLTILIGGIEQTTSLAAGMFTIGYLCSFLIPLAGGLAWDSTGDPRMAFFPLALFSLCTALLPAWLRIPSSK